MGPAAFIACLTLSFISLGVENHSRPFFSAAAGTKRSKLKASGGTLTGSLMPRLSRMYSSVATKSSDLPEVELAFISNGDMLARKQLLVDGTIHFAVLDYMVPLEDFKVYRDLFLIPLAVTAVVPIINIAELGEGETIIFSRKVLADIFQGLILQWDDPAIVALNPMITLPPEPIKLILPGIALGVTDVFTAALSEFSTGFKESIGRSAFPKWCQGTVTKAPKSPGIPYRSITCHESNDTRVFYSPEGLDGRTAALSMLPYSLTFMYHTEAMERGLTSAKLINKENATVSASVETIMNALMAIEGIFDSRYNVTAVDTIAPAGWPINSISYLAVRGRTHRDDCKHRKALVDFLRWTFESREVVEMARASGYAMLNDFSRHKLVFSISETVMCVPNCVGIPSALCTCMGSGRRCSLSSARRDAHADSDLHIGYPSFVQSSMQVVADSFSVLTPFNLVSYHGWDEKSQRMWEFLVSDSFGDLEMGLVSTKGFAFGATKDIIMDLVKDQKITSTPLFVGTIALIANLGGDVQKLTVTPELLVDIYLGNIVRWDDAKLRELNPGCPLPSVNITIVVDVGASEISKCICSYLSRISVEFSAIFSKTSNLNLLRTFRTNVIEMTSERALRGAVKSILGTFGAVWTRPEEETIEKLSIIALANTNGTELVPFLSSMSRCIESAGGKAVRQISPYAVIFDDLTATGCYPLTIEYNLVVKRVWSADAEGSATYIAKFLEWLMENVLSDSLAGLSHDLAQATLRPIANSISIGQTSILSPQPPCGREDMVYQLSECREQSMVARFAWKGGKDNRSCLGGQDLIEDIEVGCEFVPLRSSVGYGVIALVVMCLVVLLPFLGFTFYYRYSKALVASQVNFTILFIIGAVILTISSIALLGPNDSVHCVRRPWVISLSFSTLFAPLLMKLKRVYTLFGGKALKRTVVSNLRVASETSMFILVDVVILICWQFGSKMTSTTSFEFLEVLGNVPRQVCDYGDNSGLYLMLSYKGLVLGVGIYLAVKSWHIVEDYSEAKQLAIGLYNATLMGGLTLLLTLGIRTAPTIRVLLLAVSCSLVALICVVLVMTPKLFYLYKNPQSRTSTKKASTASVQRPSASAPSRGGSIMDLSSSPAGAGHRASLITHRKNSTSASSGIRASQNAAVSAAEKGNSHKVGAAPEGDQVLFPPAAAPTRNGLQPLGVENV